MNFAIQSLNSKVTELISHAWIFKYTVISAHSWLSRNSCMAPAVFSLLRLKQHGLLIKHFKLHAWMCSGKLDVWYCFIRLSINALRFCGLISQSDGVDCSVRRVAWPNQRSEYWFPAGSCLPCNTKVLSGPNQHLLIMLGWLLPSTVQFSVQHVWHMKRVSDVSEIKSCPGTFAFTQLNKLGINE